MNALTRAELISVVGATGCGDWRGDACFLHDPKSSATERAQMDEIKRRAGISAAQAGRGWLCIRSGGSSGVIKFARHDEDTLGAAVRGFCAHFELARVNAIDVLPPYHVSGLMARLRCVMTGGEHRAWEWKRLEAGERPELSTARGAWVISLVPTQLQRLMAAPEAAAWLRGFEIIFLGGGPVWRELAEAAAKAGLRISLSYGMTETAAMITASWPEEFLAGDRTSGAALPHGRVTIDPGDRVEVEGQSLFHGYWPEWRDERKFTTEDIGRIDERGRLHVLGRGDAVIITGGKKVQPLEVEAALRASREFSDVAVIGVPDAEWGEAVVACYLAGPRAPDASRASAGLVGAQRPKRFVAIAAREWPRNAQGKIDRVALRALAMR